MEIKLPPNAPDSEFSRVFVQAMADRMGFSYSKYGRVADAYPHRVNALASLKLRIAKYEATGNLEHLIDAGNFAMIEYMHPSHPEAHYEPTDSKKSPGRVWHGEVDPSQRGNRPETWVK